MKLILAIAITVIGAISIARSVRSRGERPFLGLLGLALLAVGGVWTLVIVGRSLIEGVFFVAGTIAALAVLGYFGFWLFGRLVRRKKLRAANVDDKRSYLGKVGSAVTPLRPTGVATVDGDRIDVATEGEFIAAGSRIKVVAMDSRRYFVKLAD